MFRRIDEVGGFVQSVMVEMQNIYDDTNKQEIDRIISSANSLRRLWLNSENNANDPLTAVLPLDLCSTDSRLLTKSLLHQQRRLQQRHSKESIDKQFRTMRIAVQVVRGLARILKEEQEDSVYHHLKIARVH
jgi:hypothetical protein